MLFCVLKTGMFSPILRTCVANKYKIIFLQSFGWSNVLRRFRYDYFINSTSIFMINDSFMRTATDYLAFYAIFFNILYRTRALGLLLSPRYSSIDISHIYGRYFNWKNIFLFRINYKNMTSVRHFDSIYSNYENERPREKRRDA